MLAGEGDVARAAVDLQTLGDRRGQEEPEQGIAEDGAAPGGEDRLAAADGDRGDDRARSEILEERGEPRLAELGGQLRVFQRLASRIDLIFFRQGILLPTLPGGLATLRQTHRTAQGVKTIGGEQRLSGIRARPR